MVIIEEIRYAFRDEKVNIFAMTVGGLPQEYSNQIMLCKKNMLPDGRKGPFLLDPKRSKSSYNYSEIGLEYYNIIENYNYALKYVAYIDAEVKVKISIDLFEKLAESGFFSVWDPIAPYKYFNGALEGYLVIFRVYEINRSINDDLLKTGRNGRHFYYGLGRPIYENLIAPVITDETFISMKQKFIMLLQKNGWFLDASSYETPIIHIEKDTLENIVRKEESAILENENLSLDDLKNKIEAKRINKKAIIVETKQYYRDPDISSYAQKRAGGVCECCGKAAPFIKSDNRPYLETHHIVPLSQGGRDSINNVCAVCPNCHKELHFGADKCDLQRKLINRVG